jgi:hypothetical protein
VVVDMKGIELPINILIIIAIAVIVLIAVVAMFYTPFSNGTSSISSNTAKSDACRAMLANNCGVWPGQIAIYGFDADKDGKLDPSTSSNGNCNNPGDATTGDSLWSFCTCQLGIPQTLAGCVECLKNVCGCQNIGPNICT